MLAGKLNLRVINQVSPQVAQAWIAIYKTLYESLTRFRKLLENGPKYKNKGILYPTVKSQKPLETPQKHPERMKTQRK